MKIKTFASAAVMGALGLLIPLQSSAFGLGKIELSSALNEPLKAAVSITALRLEDEATFKVQLASRDEFKKAGLKRTFLLTQLKFEVVKNGGQTEVVITSDKPVKEPFLDFLIIASTANGRLIREYTVLLDPPKHVFTKEKAVIKQAEEPKSKVPKTSSVSKQTMQNTTQTTRQPATMATASTSNTIDSYKVKSSDTLSKIAKNTRPQSDISINQMMMALLDKNESAFVNNNINQLKANRTLTIPSVEEIKQRTKRQALLDVNEQNDAWRNRNRVVTNTAVEETNQASELPIQNPQPVLESESMGAEQGDMARLELVSPGDEVIEEVGESSLLGDPKIKELTEQLTLAQETIESQAQENTDIKSRMDMMEEQLHTLRRLISLKDTDLAKLQGNLETEDALETTDADSTLNEQNEALNDDTLPKVESNDAEMGGSSISDEKIIEELLDETNSDDVVIEQLANEVSENGEVADEVSVDETMPSLDDSSESMVVVNEVQETEPEVVKSDSVATADTTAETLSTSSPSIMDSVKNFYESHKVESLGGGLLALLALIWLAIRGRREQGEDLEEQTVNVDTPAPIKFNAKANDDVNSSVADEPVIKQEEVTELEASTTEAETSILDTELEAAPEISPVIEDTIADIKEEEPLNNIADTAEVISDESSDLEFNLDGYEDSDSDVEKELDETVEESLDISDELLDFNIDKSSTELSVDSVDAPIENESLDFEQPLSLDGLSSTPELNLNDEPLNIDDSSSDFDLNFDESEPEPLSVSADMLDDLPELQPESIDEPVDILELGGTEENTLNSNPDDDVSFDLGEFDGIDEAETKLDLASAYMDMGDPEGARNILDEVMSDGSDEQKSRAQELLKELG